MRYAPADSFFARRTACVLALLACAGGLGSCSGGGGEAPGSSAAGGSSGGGAPSSGRGGASGPQGSGGTVGNGGAPDAAGNAPADARAGAGGSGAAADAGTDSGRGAGSDAAPGEAGRAACGAPTTLLCDPLRRLPTSLRDTGLFSGFPDVTKRAPRVLAFEPNPPLWTDGLHKDRALLLPAGKTVDNTKATGWSFPVGTILVKTFLDDGPAGPRPVETRIVRRVDDPFEPWQYAAYLWNAQATEATLIDFAADPARRTPVMVTVKGLNGDRPFRHDVPSRNDCADCHDKNARVKPAAIIGFDEVRLAWTLPGAAKTQLESLWEAGALAARPPATPETITDTNPRLQRIKRWVYGNCVHCHNGAGIFDLRPSVFVANTVSRPTDASGVTAPAGWLRVVPGDPERSVLFVQTRRTGLPPTGGLRPMPPIGVDLVPEAVAVEDLRQWILSLPR